MFQHLIVGALVSLYAQAAVPVPSEGAVSGGGGKGIVCRNADGSVKSVELLDLWESRTLYGGFVAPMSGDLARDVDMLLERIEGSIPWLGTAWLGNPPQKYVGQEYVLAEMRQAAAQFLSGDPRVKRLRGARLEETNDAMELARPENCEIGQVVNYQTNGFILLDQDLFDKMDETNQAALIVHEAFYDFLRKNEGERNSIRVRRTVGAAMGGYEFHADKFDPTPDTVWCVLKDAPFRASQQVALVPHESVNGTTRLDVVPQVLSGTRLIDWHTSNLSTSITLPDAQAQSILTGRCGAVQFDVGFGMEGRGRVEYDRTFEIHWTCDQGKFAVFLNTAAPGASQADVVNLTCSK
jgi:hypothetical protein